MSKVIKSRDANQSAKDLLDRIIEKTESPSFSKASKKTSSKSPLKVAKKVSKKK